MRNILFLILFSLVCTLGCGGERYFVVGSVTFPDGTPVPGGQVTLTSARFTASGDIVPESSRYTINVRVPAGTYKVSVTVSGEPGSGEATPSGLPLVDPKFSNPETSGLVCEVRGATVFDIELTPPTAIE